MGVNLIFDEFKIEAIGILDEILLVVNELEEEHEAFPKEKIEEFALKTDRLMGAAKTFNLMYPDYESLLHIARITELCKVTGYKASTLSNTQLVPIFSAFWADAIDIIRELVESVEDTAKIKEVTANFIPTLRKRLMWLAQQIIDTTKTDKTSDQSKINVDGLLKKMGFDV